MTWFYESNREQKGPVSETELDVLIANGQVLPSTLIWREGMAGWAPLQVARPAAAAAAPASATFGGDTVQCDSCGRFFPPSEVIELGGRRICAACKPVVLQSLQQGDSLADLNQRERTGPAWEHQETLGVLPSAWQTVKSVLTQPSATFATMRTTGGLTRPLWFFVLTAGIGNLAYAIYYMGFVALNSEFRQAFERTNSFNSSTVAGMVVGMLVWSVAATLIGIFIQSAVLHVCLMICGGARKPFETTFRTLAYGTGAVTLLHMVPLLGTIAYVPFVLVITCLGLAKTHETELWRTVLALFLPILVCCGLGIGLALMIGAANSAHGGLH